MRQVRRLLAVLLCARLLETSHTGSLYLQLPAQSLLGEDGGMNSFLVE